ncbi:MAG: hypothetical protein NVSMB66_4070 [Candidatus Doudnabacteria bacterium]
MKYTTKLLYLFSAFVFTFAFFSFSHQVHAGGTLNFQNGGPAQSFGVFNSTPSGGTSGTFNATTSIQTGSGWSISVSPTTGSVAPQSTATLTVTVTGTAPANTSYQGTVNVTGPGLNDNEIIILNGPSSACAISSFYASPSSVNSGSATSIYWNTNGYCTSATISGGQWGSGVAVGVNGSTATSALTASTSYTFCATGNGASPCSSITVNINPPCAISSFYASPSTVNSGTATSLYWNTTNCTSATLSGGQWGGGVGVGVNGATATAALTASTSYTFCASGNGTTPPCSSLTVTVNQPCAITGFSANPTTVNYNSSSTLSWSTSNCTSVTLSGGQYSNTPEAVNGSVATVALTATTTYTLSASSFNSTTASLTVTVNPGCVVTSFVASPNSVAYGATTNLSWNANSSCTSGTLNGGQYSNTSIGPNGSTTTAPLTTSTTFLDTQNGPTSSSSATQNVTVGQPSCTIVVNHTGFIGTFNYTLSGPATINGSNDNSYNTIAGSWNISSGSGQTSITPAANQTCSPSGTITFTLNFAPPPPCVINSFTASPNPVNYGAGTTLTWTTTNCTSSGLAGGQFGGGVAVSPNSSTVTNALTSPTIYTFTATSSVAGNTTSSSVTVGVSACTITVNHTGAANATYGYTISGPLTLNRLGDQTFSAQPTGTWTITYTGGSGSNFISYSPSNSQSCGPGATITFTLNFSNVFYGTCTVNIAHTGSPSSYSWSVSGPATFTGTNDAVAGTSIGDNNYSATYTGGNGYPPTSITPAASQYCAPNSSITFTFNFVVPTPPPPTGPTSGGGSTQGGSNPTAENSAINSSVSCAQIELFWGPANTAVSYNLYRSTSSGTPGAIWQNTTALNYLDTTPVIGTTYYYWVQSVNTYGGVSAPTATNSIAATPCQVNLSTSGKYIAQVNSLNNIYSSPCTTAPVGSSRIIKKGDVLQLRIEICNTGSGDANNVVVSDNLANGANLTLDPTPNVAFVGGTSPSYTVSGNSITFNIGTVAIGTKAIITFNADVTPSASNTQTLQRLRNFANVTYTSTITPPNAVGCTGTSATNAQPCVVDTGYVVFYNGVKAPVIKEVNP